MAQQNKRLIAGKVEISKVLDALSSALSEEWLAYYQNWIAARTVTGPMRADVCEMFQRHGADELSHANSLCRRILELDGVPVLTPRDWYGSARCVYEAPTSFEVEYLLKSLRRAEECSMIRYQELIELTEGCDYITADLARKILTEEARHEQEIQDYLSDLSQLRKYYSR